MKKSGINKLAVAALISALIVFAGIIIFQLGSIEIAEPVECTEPVVVGMPEVIDRRIIASDTYELLYKTTFSNGLSVCQWQQVDWDDFIKLWEEG